jgi:hypothetical protein
MTEPVSEERQRAYFDRARKGVLTWLAAQEGSAATLHDLHEYSSDKFLVAHQGFSRMMESFVAEDLVVYDEATRTATLTDAARRFIAP